MGGRTSKPPAEKPLEQKKVHTNSRNATQTSSSTVPSWEKDRDCQQEVARTGGHGASSNAALLFGPGPDAGRLPEDSGSDGNNSFRVGGRHDQNWLQQQGGSRQGQAPPDIEEFIGDAEEMDIQSHAFLQEQQRRRRLHGHGAKIDSGNQQLPVRVLERFEADVSEEQARQPPQASSSSLPSTKTQPLASGVGTSWVDHSDFGPANDCSCKPRLSRNPRPGKKSTGIVMLPMISQPLQRDQQEMVKDLHKSISRTTGNDDEDPLLSNGSIRSPQHARMVQKRTLVQDTSDADGNLWRDTTRSDRHGSSSRKESADWNAQFSSCRQFGESDEQPRRHLSGVIPQRRPPLSLSHG